MDRGKNCCRDVVPFWAIIAMNFTTVGLHTLFKAATNHGMSYHVFIVYAYGVAALVLLPSPFFSLRSTVLPPLNFSLSCKILLLGLIGMEKLAIRSSSSQAKIIGTVVSISGALVVTLYKGPPIISTLPASISLHRPLGSPHSDWVIGSLFLTVEFMLVPMWYIVQTQIMKEYPAELTVVFFYNLCVSVLAAIVGIFAEPNASAWRIKADIGLVSIICSGIFGSFLDNAVNTWVLKVKGPLYVAMFKPLSIVIAVVMGVLFLGDTLYLGSIVGAAIISVGFYTVMWGKAKEDVDESGEIGDPESASNPKVPLLQKYLTQEPQS
ncbi:hypothetical protein RHGRI_028260 [Rhododendron griersonianum]|uniref:WAT1-related protein n=1 Tax=Rhododendron griersonianum TaxID=479676 RepID=A0AAV6IFM1_9ERIC|nr:hypothetical protein RHGRI_028260 [Rhododendron griersonianum]KAG5527303.1 hypothetical protein RHGRI_028260 [Rhododendron griersonianum]